MPTILDETRFILNKYNIKADKKLGQNFLISDEAVSKIIDSSDITENDLVIEIGPGLGTLTKELLERAGKVICIELDPRMVKILKERFSLYDNFGITYEDVLKVDLELIIQNEKKKESIKSAKVVANLPYYITTPIIMKLLEEKLDLTTITVMVQKEVADRIVEKPGDKESGAVTYSVYYYSYPRKICFVSKECFIPSPEVDSEVIQLQIRKEPIVKVKDEEMFFKVIKASFMQRRKTLLNGLINGGLISNKDEGKNILTKLEIPENIRGEKLTTEQFAQIADEIYTKINK